MIFTSTTKHCSTTV